MQKRFKISKDLYLSQLVDFSDETLKSNGCGIASVGMVMKYYSKLININELAKYIIEKHVDGDIPVVKRKINIGSEEITITVGKEEEVNPELGDIIEKGNQDQFNPTFTLKNGYDHRGSKSIFKDFDIQADIVENTDINKIIENLITGHYEFFLPSIHSLRRSWSHIVVLDHVSNCEYDSNDLCVYIIDPGEENYNRSMKIFDLEFFKKLYNGHGTAVFGVADRI